MSTNDNNDDDPSGGSGHGGTLPVEDCYWFSQGKCFIGEISSALVYEFLCRSPEARLDLLNCAGTICPLIPQEFIDLAENTVTDSDALNESDVWQRFINRFVDRHRQIAAGAVFKTPKGDD